MQNRRTQSSPAIMQTPQPQTARPSAGSRFHNTMCNLRSGLGNAALGLGICAGAFPVTAPVTAPLASAAGIGAGLAAGGAGIAAATGHGPNTGFDQAGYVQGVAGGAQALAHAVPGLGPAVGIAAGATSAVTGGGRAGYTLWNRLRNNQRLNRQDMMQVGGDAWGAVTGGRYDATGGVGPTDAMTGAFVGGGRLAL